MIDFLFISNGHGEDAIAAKIAQLVSENYSAAGFPLVGEGHAYRNRGIEVVAGIPAPPGGGISLWKDIRGGLLESLLKQWQTLKGFRSRVRHAVAVGDILPCFFARYGLKRDFSFVGTAKSVDVQAYNIFERRILTQAARCFVRDAKTAESLKRRVKKAEWAGNPMMDELDESKSEFPAFRGRTVAVLPGSRDDAPRNFLIQVEALNALARSLDSPVRGIVLVAPTHDIRSFLSKVEGWDGIFAPRLDSAILGEIEQEDVSLIFTDAGIGDVLRASSLVFGQAGTANEQAAGFGRPVVAFDFDYYRNGMLSWYRWRQKKLLGTALEVVYPNAESMGFKAVEILKDRAVYDKIAEEGKARMGPSGGSKKIAEALKSLVV